ncbi:hexosaminidase [Candidatus Planktophila dulcis]|uniref:beta-N-acetylhexosaminidase n=1 Tax=Candidatus Planktophila dulcis TaxID=1884914 RepID=UPI000BACD570|nr:family 20 glycosylhydrolase [Candidatus Planktophila dulcis]ASY21835.1 hexosaminidase [Candidatus Planktophila dulcis]
MMRWRGAMLDISRHYFDATFIKKTISSLAIFDYNTLHLHLTDDQGWRLESKVFPLLHEVGSIRKQSQNNHGLLEPTYDGKEHSGYLTHNDVREIVSHAHSLGMQVVPEVNIPGHTGALLAAYPQFGVNKAAVEVSGRWGISDYLLRPFPETFEFLTKVFEEVAELFPSEYIHVGGDESLIDNWLKDPEVVAFMKEKDFASTKELFMFFMKEIEKIISGLGKKMVTWDDAFAFDPEQATQATVMSWRGSAIAQIALDHGREVIQGPVFPTYLDYSQEVSESEPLAIGGPVTLEDVLAFTPLPGVTGVQFQLWSEYIQFPLHAEYMTWPRAAALAFRCWGEGQDFESYFAERRPLLEKLDVTIRDVDPLKRAKIAHLGIGPYDRGFDTASMMEALEKSAVAGEVAHDF